MPDSDLFNALKSGKASVETDHIETFTHNGIKLKSGKEIEADIVVTATGLQLQFMNGVDVSVDGTRTDAGRLLNYKGVMLSNMPNLAVTFGYTNASWTLKADLTSEYVCRLLNYMDQHGYTSAMPKLEQYPNQTEPFVDFSSGYFQRRRGPHHAGDRTRKNRGSCTRTTALTSRTCAAGQSPMA